MKWPDIPLGEVAQPVERVLPVVPGTPYRTVGVRWWGQGAYERETIDGSQTAARRLSAVREGDLIINKIWVRHGSVAIAGKAVDGCAASNEFPTFRLDESRVLARWMHWQTQTSSFWEKCAALSRGTSGKNRIRPGLFLTIRVSLPPLPEQRRIVARIEQLAAKIGEARGVHALAVEQALALLPAAASKTFGASSSDTYAPIGRLAEVRGGIQKSPSRVPDINPVRYLTVAHVGRNHISLEQPRYFEVAPEELPRWRLEPGDVLIIEGNGSADQIGRTALFRGEIDPCVHQNHVIRIRPDRDYIDSEYLNLYLNSPAGQDEVHSRSRTTSGLRNLSVGRIKQISVPVPSLSEQRKAVEWLQSLDSQITTLHRAQTETGLELNAMLPAVLDRAFGGSI